MITPKKRCLRCGESFQPNPRTWKFQKTCRKKACQKARARAKWLRWASLHPDYTSSRKAKRKAWAKAYPNYWQHYRSNHPDYCERDNARRAKALSTQRCSAKQTAIRNLAVEKLQAITRLEDPNCSAKPTAIHRRVDRILDYLLWTVNEGCSAKPMPMASLGPLAVG